MAVGPSSSLAKRHVQVEKEEEVGSQLRLPQTSKVIMLFVSGLREEEE